MTTDPVRLLAQDDDAFASSLLKAGRDGDAATARARKVAVLGAAAGGAALGGAAIVGAQVASKGVWATFTGKWLAAFMILAGGAGVAAAVLLSDGGGAPANESHSAPVTAPVETQPAARPSEPSPPSEPASAERPASDREPAPLLQPAEQPASPDPAASAPASPSDGSPASPVKSAAPTAQRSGNASPEPASAATGAPAAAASSASPASSAPSDPASELAEEVAAIRAAREALGRGQAQKCLEAVSAYFARFPKGHLSAEARLLRIEAMAASGQRDQAAAQARAMLAANPHSPYAARLRAIAGESASP